MPRSVRFLAISVVAARTWTPEMDASFTKKAKQCNRTCKLNCGDGDRDWTHDSLQPQKFFISRCEKRCEVVFPQFSSPDQDDFMKAKGCKARCREVHENANLCREAQATNRHYPDQKHAKEVYGLDWCRFEAEVSIAPRYFKQHPGLDFVYYPEEWPTTNVGRDDTFLLKLLNTTFAPDPDYVVQRSMLEWFYQDWNEFRATSIPEPADTPDAARDWDQYMTIRGETCQSYLIAEHEPEVLAGHDPAKVEWETCGERCIRFCDAACNCHWDDTAKTALEQEGKGSLFSWGYDADKTEVNWRCIQGADRKYIDYLTPLGH